MSSRETIFSRIKKLGHVPVLPEILVRLLEACDNEATPLKQVASLIGRDPSLSYKVLQLVNSAYFGLRTTYSGVDQAVVYLGANSVKNMAVTAAVHQVFDSQRFDSLKFFNIHLFWHHSLSCASLARRMAERTGQANPDDAYLGGLLHDLGKLVLVAAFPEQYEAVIAEAQGQEDLAETERSHIGASHPEIGAWLMTEWKFSPLIADAVAYHHEPVGQIGQALALVKIVFCANGLSKDGDLSGARAAAETLLGVGGEELARIVDGVGEEILQISSELGIVVETPAPGEGDEGRTVVRGEDGATLQASLASRIKGISLLSGFLENMAEAGDSEAMIRAFEQALRVLFGFDRVVPLLPDRDQVLLCGRTSRENRLHNLGLELVLPLRKSGSRIVETFRTGALAYLHRDQEQDSLADRQVLSALGCRTVALVPLGVGQRQAGVALVGLPEPLTELTVHERRLLGTIAQQAGLGLHLEEVKARRAEEVEAERKAAISMTARKFAHEVNNPLGIINNYLATLKLKMAGEARIQNELSIISEEINRISAMINQLDTFAQASFQAEDPTNVNSVIADIVQLVRSSFLGEAATEIEFRPDPSLPLIRTSTDALKQIVINLVKNASEAMEAGGRVVVSTARLQAGGPAARDGVVVAVEDDGPGLPELVRQHLFTPFISTKGIGHSGLGLSIVSKAVADLGGTIDCTSEPGRGARFEIYLPSRQE